MNIQLSKNLETSILTLVKSGQFASIDDAMNEAVRLLLKHQAPAQKPVTEADLLKHMLETGLLSRLPETTADFDDPEDQPITIIGESLSETVIRDRR